MFGFHKCRQLSTYKFSIFLQEKRCTVRFICCYISVFSSFEWLDHAGLKNADSHLKLDLLSSEALFSKLNCSEDREEDGAWNSNLCTPPRF